MTTRMNTAPGDLLEARRQIASMCRKLEAALQTLRDKAVEARETPWKGQALDSSLRHSSWPNW